MVFVVGKSCYKPIKINGIVKLFFIGLNFLYNFESNM